MIIKMYLLSILLLGITACTPTQRPLKNGQGYVVLPAGENHYRIEYYLKYATLAETYWNTTAGQLCPGGFQVLYNKKHVLNFDMYVPIAGNNVNIERQEFIQYGEVKCEGEPSIGIMLTESNWREFNSETKSIKPVSERWLTETLQLYVSHLSVLPGTNAVATLAKDWGKPQRQLGKNGEVLSVWTKGGDSWFPNQVGLLEYNNCLKLIIVLPGSSIVMASIVAESSLPVGNLELLIKNGGLSAYFYKPHPDNCF
ncbi:hypothetical protein CBP51_04540 [Cellvibrio mixtus]|uniref:Lipoprotein n=1 Tax=Cellvibrio mixtus TaxID=39650 RepID=A0A266Q900_9GAMM|nr:hypothetical protein [Cellvibrio mixtus]OZY86300.1 hypothetical protein CBP51_04540 [Cellvibrio mixtus]